MCQQTGHAPANTTLLPMDAIAIVVLLIPIATNQASLKRRARAIRIAILRPPVLLTRALLLPLGHAPKNSMVPVTKFATAIAESTIPIVAS